VVFEVKTEIEPQNGESANNCIILQAHKLTAYAFNWTLYAFSDKMGGGPSHIPAHTSSAVAASFRIWPGSRTSVAGGPGPPSIWVWIISKAGRLL